MRELEKQLANQQREIDDWQGKYFSLKTQHDIAVNQLAGLKMQYDLLVGQAQQRDREGT